MSIKFASFTFLLVLSLSATANIVSPEDDDMDLFERTWDSGDPKENIGRTKRGGIRNFNVGKLSGFRKFLEKARKQQFLMTQQEGQHIKAKGRHFLSKVLPNTKIQNIQTLEAPFRGSLSPFSAAGGLPYGRG